MRTKQILKKYYNIEIELLLTHILNKSKEFLFMNPDFELSSCQEKKLSSYIKRRQKGEPIAYILGYKDFFGLRFKVNKNVLIPRPETEGLVEKTLQTIKKQELRSKNGNKLRILDVGTGSGCIIISLAIVLSKQYSVNSTQFYASDVSKKALATAKENAENHKVKIKFIHSDILQNVGIPFNIVVANLPYIPASDYRQLRKSLRYEPNKAIFTKNRGLMLIEKLLKQISELKKQPKIIFLEFDPRQKINLNKLIKKYLFGSKINFYKDLSQRWRYVVIFAK